MSTVTPLHSILPSDEPPQILLDGNVRVAKLFKALVDAGFVLTWGRHCEVLRISERVSN